jgi:hypothetical protein
MKVTLRLVWPVDFYFCVLHLLSGLGDIRYMRFAHNSECREDRHIEGRTLQ